MKAIGSSMPTMPPTAHHVAVVGGGPGGLMAAEVLATAGVDVTVYEQMPSVGRKFLLAGRSGLNLTHSEPIDRLLTRYGPAAARLEPAIRAFPPTALRDWAEGLGQRTYVGSSGRVFPDAMRATPLLRAWLGRLAGLGVEFCTRTTWTGWAADGSLRFTAADGSTVSATPDATVLALGGASWPRVGSNGAWFEILAAQGITTIPFRPANCGFIVNWSDHFRTAHAGTPLKNIRLTSAADGTSIRGETVITNHGIEGGAVYMLSASLRDAVESRGSTTLLVDLHPDRSHDDLAARLAKQRTGDSRANHLRRATGLSGVALALVGEVQREAAADTTDDDPDRLAALIKALPIVVTATSPIDRAISTAGGVALTDIDESWMVRARPGVYVTGEMIDWEAPTGGYLLQATFSTAVAAAHAILERELRPRGRA